MEFVFFVAKIDVVCVCKTGFLFSSQLTDVPLRSSCPFTQEDEVDLHLICEETTDSSFPTAKTRHRMYT